MKQLVVLILSALILSAGQAVAFDSLAEGDDLRRDYLRRLLTLHGPHVDEYFRTHHADRILMSSDPWGRGLLRGVTERNRRPRGAQEARMNDVLTRDQRVRLESGALAVELVTGRKQIESYSSDGSPVDVIQVATALEAYVRGDGQPEKVYRPSKGAEAARQALEWVQRKLQEPQLENVAGVAPRHLVDPSELEALEVNLEAALEDAEEPLDLASYPSVLTLLRAGDRMLVALGELELEQNPEAGCVEAERAHLHQAVAAIRTGGPPPALGADPETDHLVEAAGRLLEALIRNEPVSLDPELRSLAQALLVAQPGNKHAQAALELGVR